VRTSDNIDEHEVCCYELVSVDSASLVLYLLLCFVYIFNFQNPNFLELDYDLISLDIKLIFQKNKSL
jgi:hypothetical protein